MRIYYSKSAVKAINSFDSKTKQRIKEAVEGLVENPPKGDIKPLRGFDNKQYRLRKGGIRVIFNFTLSSCQEKTLHIIDIGMRGDIYK